MTVIQGGEGEEQLEFLKSLLQLLGYAWFYYYSVFINGLNKEGKYSSFNLSDIRQED